MRRGLHLTPDMLEAGYRLLLTTLPFRRWCMPNADEVHFYATSIDATGPHGSQGEYWFDGTSHHLRVNPHKHHTLQSALLTLAHEMVHLRVGLKDRGAHGAEFQRLADQVCQHHGFDRGQF